MSDTPAQQTTLPSSSASVSSTAVVGLASAAISTSGSSMQPPSSSSAESTTTTTSTTTSASSSTIGATSASVGGSGNVLGSVVSGAVGSLGVSVISGVERRHCVGLGASQELLLVGGKGAGLSGLVSAGFTVPPGFIITSAGYELYKQNASKHRTAPPARPPFVSTFPTLSPKPVDSASATPSPTASTVASTTSSTTASSPSTTTTTTTTTTSTVPESLESSILPDDSLWPEELSYEIEMRTTLLVEQWIKHPQNHAIYQQWQQEQQQLQQQQEQQLILLRQQLLERQKQQAQQLAEEQAQDPDQPQFLQPDQGQDESAEPDGNSMFQNETTKPSDTDPASDLSQQISLPQLQPPSILRSLSPALLPKFAVRSSSADEDSRHKAFAGMHKTFLNVPADKLHTSIMQCWDSANNERSQLYRLALGEKAAAMPVRFAVVVQCMVQPICSGYVFTINPITGNTGEVVVNCIQGLGEPVVPGTVLPTQFIFNKRDYKLKSYSGTIADPNALMASPVWVTLLGQCLSVERQLFVPQDIEWAWDGTTLWFLQARPVTKVELKPLNHQNRDIFTSFNTKESMGHVSTPLTWSVFKQVIDNSMSELCNSLSVPYFTSRGFYELKWGRLYQNSNVNHEIAMKLFGSQWNDTAKYFNVPEKVVRLATYPAVSMFQKMQGLVTVLTMLWKSSGFVDTVEREALAARQRFVRDYNEFDATRLDLREAGVMLDSMVAHFVPIGIMYMNLILHSGIFHQTLGETFGEQSNTLTSLLATLGGVWTADQNQDLFALAQTAATESAVMQILSAKPLPTTWRTDLQGTKFQASLDQFLLRYGFRAERDMEVACPRWSERPEIVLEIVGSIARSINGTESDRSSQRITQLIDARQVAEQAALRSQSFLTRPLLNKVLVRFQEITRSRENTKTLLVLYIALCRKYLLHIASILVKDGLLENPEDIYFLSLAEVVSVCNSVDSPTVRNQVRLSIQRNRLQIHVFENMEAPELFVGHTALKMTHPKRTFPTTQTRGGLPPLPPRRLIGWGASVGCVAGRACVATTPYEGIQKLTVGNVLVCKTTDSAWTPLFLKASAVVVENGGILSHGAITARELGIPTVVGAADCMNLIHDGEAVNVDGTYGVITFPDGGSATSVTTGLAASRLNATNAKCLVCLAAQREVVCNPCKHITSCLQCSISLNECPVCRATVQSVVQVY